MKRKISDCFYYYNGYCYKGDNCPFRHEPRALGSSRVCRRWRKRMCNKPHCPHRHSNFRLRHLASPRYWEDRSGRSPFLKSRYYVSHGYDGNNQLPLRPTWTRKVFLVGDEQRNDRMDFNQFSPRLCDRRDWNEQPERRYPSRENIRVLLERVQDPESPFGRIFLEKSLIDNENPPSYSLNTMSENFRRTPQTVVFKIEPTEESVSKPKTISSHVSDAICTCNKRTKSGLFQVVNKGLVEPILTGRGSGEAVPWARSDKHNLNENAYNRSNNIIPAAACSNNKVMETSEDRFKSFNVWPDKKTEVFSSNVNAINSHRSHLLEVPGVNPSGSIRPSSEESSKDNKILKGEVGFNNITDRASKPDDFPDSKTTVKPRGADKPSDLTSMLTQLPSTNNTKKSPPPCVSDSLGSCGPHKETLSVGYYTRLRARIKAESEKSVK